MKKILFLLPLLFFSNPILAANYQIFTNQTANSDSLPFRINLSGNATQIQNNDSICLQIYGTLDGANFDLQSLTPANTYKTTNDNISGLGDYCVPYNSQMVLRLNLSNVGGSTSINAIVYNGAPK